MIPLFKKLFQAQKKFLLPFAVIQIAQVTPLIKPGDPVLQCPVQKLPVFFRGEEIVQVVHDHNGAIIFQGVGNAV